MRKTTLFSCYLRLPILLVGLVISLHTYGDLPKTVEKVTPSVVAIGLFTPIGASGNQVLGTGFVVGDGKHAVTNYHVVSKILDPSIVQHYVVISGKGRKVKTFKAEVLSIDPVHDLALLAFEGNLPAITLANDELLPPGKDIAFTGFPIGAAIGLYPATHKGMISAITPDAIPAQNADQLTVSMLQRLKTPELVYQLDATAYPGNSGSPVYHVDSGEVVGVINKVFVSQGKESALSAPSGISYAIPIVHARSLMKKEGL
jgi:S1-C subfamily serine protease